MTSDATPPNGEKDGSSSASDDSEDEPQRGLYDCSPIQDGKRERKKIERLSFAGGETKERFEMPEGRGTKFGMIPFIANAISKEKSGLLKPLHNLLFNTAGRVGHIKKNLREFRGFAFADSADDEEYNKRAQRLLKMTLPELKPICAVLGLERSGSKEELVKRMMTFLIDPQDSGKSVPKPKKRRSSTKKPGKTKRAKKGKKDKETEVASSAGESDEGEEEDEDEDEEEEEDEEKENRKVESATSGSEEEEEEEEKKVKSKKKPTKKIESKTAPKKSSKAPSTKSTKEKGAKNKGAIAAPKKPAPKKKKSPLEAMEEQMVDDADISDSDSDSDDEPLAKKKVKFPSDAELEAVARKLLEGADLDSVTMKGVLKDVRDSFPDVDLSAKKDFLKATVKQIIS